MEALYIKWEKVGLNVSSYRKPPPQAREQYHRYSIARNDLSRRLIARNPYPVFRNF